jgi:hypothetical protein
MGLTEVVLNVVLLVQRQLVRDLIVELDQIQLGHHSGVVLNNSQSTRRRT